MGLLVAVPERVAELEIEEVGEDDGVFEMLADWDGAGVALLVGDEDAGTLLDGDTAGELAGVLVAV